MKLIDHPATVATKCGPAPFNAPPTASDHPNDREIQTRPQETAATVRRQVKLRS